MTAQPLVQRFLLFLALVLAAYLGLLQGRRGDRAVDGAGRPRRVPVPSQVAGEATRPLLGVDLNHASAAELALLPGIGPVAAEAIVKSRRREGPFRSVSDLQRVHGIGPKTAGAVRPYLLPLPGDAEKMAAVR